MSKLDANWCRVCRSMMYDPTRSKHLCRDCKRLLFTFVVGVVCVTAVVVSLIVG